MDTRFFLIVALLAVAGPGCRAQAAPAAPAPPGANALGDLIAGVAQAAVAIANQTLTAMANTTTAPNATAPLPPPNATFINQTMSVLNAAVAPLAQALNATAAPSSGARPIALLPNGTVPPPKHHSAAPASEATTALLLAAAGAVLLLVA